MAESGKSQGTLNTNALTASSVTLDSEWRSPAQHTSHKGSKSEVVGKDNVSNLSLGSTTNNWLRRPSIPVLPENTQGGNGGNSNLKALQAQLEAIQAKLDNDIKECKNQVEVARKEQMTEFKKN